MNEQLAFGITRKQILNNSNYSAPLFAFIYIYKKYTNIMSNPNLANKI